MLARKLALLGKMARSALLGVLGSAGLYLVSNEVCGAPPRPNLIFVLADDLGWGDVGCNGQTMIRTPRIDQMRAEGVNFTQAYCGSAVCAPSRYCLLTGFHTGHATVFDFTSGASGANWRIEDAQLPQLLHGAGYETWFTGKWGFGAAAADERSSSFSDASDVLLASELDFLPPSMGWDYSLAFLNHGTAHYYFPDFLWENDTRIPLPGNYHLNYGTFPDTGARSDYAQDEFHQQILSRIQAANGSRPFYAQCSYILPHRETMAPPGFNPYSATGWPDREQAYASMITYLDKQLGEIIDAVEANPAIRDNTLIIFTGDNGPQYTDGRTANFTGDNSFFNSNGPFKANKFNLYEGGVRVPFIARWRGHLAAGGTQTNVITFWDFLPTACELAGVKPPSDLDGISYAPLLTGEGSMSGRGPIIFHIVGGGAGPGWTTAIERAIRVGDLKLCVPTGGSLANAELYNLATDPGEANNLASLAPTSASLMYSQLIAEDSGPRPVLPGRAELYGGLTAEATPAPGLPVSALTSTTVAMWRFDNDGKVAGQICGTAFDAKGCHPAIGLGSPIGVTQAPRYACDLFSDFVPRSLATNSLALSFSPALGQYLQVPDAPDLDLTSSAFTIEGWIRLRKLAAGLNETDRQWLLYKKGLGTSDVMLDFGFLAQMGDFAAVPGPGKSSNQTGREIGMVFGTGSTNWGLTSRLKIMDHEWHYLAVSIDLWGGHARFVVDATSETLNFSAPALVGNNNGPLVIGAHHNSSSVYNQFLDGVLDEVRISGTWLDASQLLGLPLRASRVRHWNMDFGTIEAGSNPIRRTFGIANAADHYSNLLIGEFTGDGLADSRLSFTTGTVTGLADGARSASFSLTLTPNLLGSVDQQTTISIRNLGHGSLALGGLNVLHVGAQVVDHTPPVLTLNGPSTITLIAGTLFDDPGATALDSFDGDLSSSIKRTGALNLNQRGDWMLTYQVSDSSGNSAMPVTRIVQVVGPVLNAPAKVSFLDEGIPSGKTSTTQTPMPDNSGDADQQFSCGSIDWPGLAWPGYPVFAITATNPSNCFKVKFRMTTHPCSSSSTFVTSISVSPART